VDNKIEGTEEIIHLTGLAHPRQTVAIGPGCVKTSCFK
jgi:hypothetical protein